MSEEALNAGFRGARGMEEGVFLLTLGNLVIS